MNWEQPDLLELLNPEPKPEPRKQWVRKFGDHHVYYNQTPDGPHGWIRNYCRQCERPVPEKRGWHWSGPGHICISFCQIIAKLVDPESHDFLITEINADHFPTEWDGTLFTCKCGTKLGRTALLEHVQGLPSGLPDSYWQLVGRTPPTLD